jgi:hypothetical protein
MPPTKRGTTKKAEVVLDGYEGKKHSLKFYAAHPVPGMALTNVYLTRYVWEQMGSPEKVKVTVEPA